MCTLTKKTKQLCTYFANYPYSVTALSSYYTLREYGLAQWNNFYSNPLMASAFTLNHITMRQNPKKLAKSWKINLYFMEFWIYNWRMFWGSESILRKRFRLYPNYSNHFKNDDARVKRMQVQQNEQNNSLF